MIRIVCIVLGCVLLASTPAAYAQTARMTEVTVILDWTPNTNHLGLYIAQAKGYYAEAGLNVTIQPAGDIAVEQVVATGTAQFGVSYQETVTYALAEGDPLVSVAAVIQHNTSGFASLADKKPLKTPADLAGKRYGGFGSAIEQPIINALITCKGGKPDSYEYIDIGFTEPLPLMERDRIDFVWLFYGWDGIRAEQQGFMLDFLMLRDYPECAPDYYTPILITSQAMIDGQPEIVRGFVEATARGYMDAINDPAEAAAILLKAVPDLDAKLVTASAAWLAKQFQADAPRWGEQKREVWQNFTEFMLKSGALTQTVDVDKAFTNNFLPGQPG